MTFAERRETPLGRLTQVVVTRPRASAALLFALLMAVTVLGTLATHRTADQDVRERVARETTETIGILERRIGAYTEILVGVRGLFELDAAPPSARFSDFVRGMQLPARYPGIKTVAYATVVEPVDRAAFLRRMRAQHGGAAFRVRPSRPDDRQVIISYLEPITGNARAVGFDLLSEQHRAAAVQLTQQTGRPSMTAPIRLLQDGKRGFLVTLAVRAPGDSLVSSSAGRLIGVTSAAFNATEFLAGLLPPGRADGDLEVYDVGATAGPHRTRPAAGNLLYDSDRDLRALRPIDPRRAATRTIDVGGRRWLVFFAPRALDTGAVRLPLAVLSGGLLVSVLASWLLLTLGLGRTRAVELAVEMTGELRQAQSRFRTAFADAPIGMALVALDGRWMEANRALCAMLGYSEDELQERTFHDVMDPGSQESAGDLLPSLATGTSHERDYVRRDGTTVTTSISASLVRDADGSPQHFIAQIEDITERRRADQRFRDLLEAAPDAMVIVGQDGRIVLANTQTLRLFGYSRVDLVGQPVEVLIPERLRDGHAAHRDAYGSDPHSRPMGAGLELFARRKDGAEVPVEISLSPLDTADGRLVSAAIRDVSVRREEAEKLRYLAEHDELTGLRNRRTFEADLARETARARRYSEGAMLLIDIDSLKDINDTLGHAQGDELIRSVGTLIATRVRSTDMVARIGGDEFAVLMPDTPIDAARGVAEELLQSIRDHGVVLGAQRQRLTASMGLAAFGSAGASIGEDVMVAADLALYEAKESGRDRAVVFTADAPDAAQRQQRTAWSQRLRQALDRGQLTAYVQPIMTLATGQITQYELLVRLIDENGNAIPPSAFMPTAERTGLVREIDRFMIERAIELIAAPHGAGPPISYEVNLSARSLADPELPPFVSGLLQRTGADPSRLVFEITETAAIANMEQARGFADALRDLGCGFALDDFGAGFASFYYLKHMPLDFLKIDGDFVRTIIYNRTDQLVVRHMAEIAANLGLQTIAEFVEDEATLELLTELGVDHVQGYYIGRPVPSAAPAPTVNT
ncbi:EAL domain-containing protein [Paraconexibacter sp.]|uniref:bifunctional diguanylate cyclase/phosphodiesterase n=1 Tax=Paraconexibacter sp. TaxID=2949640 RepID=UPI0035618D37